MKKVLLIDGGVRHILFYLGCNYMAFVIMSTFGMFKSLFESQAGMVIASTIVGTIVAGFIEGLIDKFYGNPLKKGGSIFSMPDVICSGIGILLGGIIYVIFPDSIIAGSIAVLLMVFGLLDYRHKIVQGYFS